MEMPTIANELLDEERGVLFRVMAYRTLTVGELYGAVRLFLSTRRQRKLKRGAIVEIVSIIGCRDDSTSLR